MTTSRQDQSMPKTPVLHVPVITPLTAQGAVDVPTLADLVRDVFSNGAAGVVLFGTLGEAPSFSAAERKAALDALLHEGIDADRVMVGTGAASIADVVDLSRHALSVGCARQLLLPPFFFKNVTEEGVYRFFSAAIAGAGDSRLRLTLYDIPQVVSVEIAPSVIARLVEAFGAVIAGIKDSVPSLDHVEETVAGFPHLDVWVGNEIFLPQALKLGGAGAISGLGNIAPRQMATVVAAGAQGDSAQFRRMCDLYHEIARHPVIPAVKALTAQARGEPRLAEVRPPLVTFDAADHPALTAAVEGFVFAPE
jgi:4-hydroxy-tetrahydrodipicolinate synthase